LLVGAFLWYIWYLNANVVVNLESLQSFDPFQILDIANDATLRDIKK
jgi:preprotein translocase subunit Sec63